MLSCLSTEVIDYHPLHHLFGMHMCVWFMNLMPAFHLSDNFAMSLPGGSIVQ